MSWKDRILLSAITTPDKRRFNFEYGDLEKRVEKKTSKYRFGDIDGTLVQDFGLGEVSIPLTIYFSGADYDLLANSFERSAIKKGISILEHPVYGIMNVVIESFQRNDALRTNSNQAVFILTITETIKEIIPSIGQDTSFGILSAVQGALDAIGTAYSASALADTVKNVIAAASRITDFVNEFTAAVVLIASTVDEVTYIVDSTRRYITDNIDTLLTAPLELATSIQTLISAPALAITTIKDKMNIYKTLYENLFDDITGSDNQDKKNKCAEKQMILGSLVCSMCEIALQPQSEEVVAEFDNEIVDVGFLSRTDAIKTALELIEVYYGLQEYLDELQQETEGAALSFLFTVDTAVAENLRLVIAATVRNLIRLSFDLDQERIKVYESEKDIISICYDLYGTSSNETLDKLIRTNKLEGDDIIWVPAGKEIKYYV